MKFTQQDIKQIEERGLTLQQVKSQLEIFKSGLPLINLQSAANIEHGINGIKKLTDVEKRHYIEYFDWI